MRHKVFSDQWVKDNLEEFHKDGLKEEDVDVEYPYMGYPDNGAGLYARKLPYKDWFEFNCAQRVHMNSVEHLSYTIPLFFASGIFFPRFVAGMGGVVLVGRELYRVGYMTPEGPTSKIREMGAIPLNVAELLVLGSVAFIFVRYAFGPYIWRRKFVKKYFTHTPVQIEMENQYKDLLL